MMLLRREFAWKEGLTIVGWSWGLRIEQRAEKEGKIRSCPSSDHPAGQ